MCPRRFPIRARLGGRASIEKGSVAGRYTVRSAYKNRVGQAPFDFYKRLILITGILILISGVILHSFR